MTVPDVSHPTRLNAVALSVPKAGRTNAENEDHAAFDLVTGRFAVADGASTSARSEVWSRLLVDCFVQQRSDPLVPAVLTGLRSRWHAEVDRPGLPWYAQAKLQEGAGSTFLGLQIDLAENTFHASVVGDCCLFHVRGPELLSSGPVNRPEQFGRYPDLIRSARTDSDPAAIVISASYRPGDVFLLATDAMAKLLMTTCQRTGRAPVVGHLTRSRSQFVRRIAAYRRRGPLDNDDTTLCVVTT